MVYKLGKVYGNGGFWFRAQIDSCGRERKIMAFGRCTIYYTRNVYKARLQNADFYWYANHKSHPVALAQRARERHTREREEVKERAKCREVVSSNNGCDFCGLMQPIDDPQVQAGTPVPRVWFAVCG